MNVTLRLLLSDLYPGALAPEHRANIQESGLTEATITQHKYRSIPPDLIDVLVGFRTPKLMSAYLLPYPDPRCGWMMDHVRLRVFPAYEDDQGHTTKYLSPKGSAPRLYFPIPTIPALPTSEPIWLVEGEKKSLAVCQLGLPAAGFAGVEAWHVRGSSTLLADFANIHLDGRTVELVPDADVATNPAVARGIAKFAEALRARGARPRLVRLPVAA